MPTLLARLPLDSPTVVLCLVLTILTVLSADSVLLATVPMLDMLDTLVLDTLDMLVLDILDMLVLDILVMPTRLLLLPLPTDTPLLDTDMPDTTASVRLRPKLILMLMPMLTLSLRSLLDSPFITPLLPDMPTMLE